MNEFEQKLSEIIRARCQGHLPSVGAERFLHDAAQELIGCLQKDYASEDLEKEIDRVFFKNECSSQRLHHKEIADIARHFANWQRKKDEAETK